MENKMKSMEGIALPSVPQHSSASFGIRAEDLLPDQITQALGVQPTNSWSKGTVVHARSGSRQRPWGIWSLDTENAVSSSELEDHLVYLLNVLEARRDALDQYLRNPDYSVAIYLWYVGESGADGFTLTSDVLNRACRLCNLINVTFSSITDGHEP
jgi:hypothetical protein